MKGLKSNNYIIRRADREILTRTTEAPCPRDNKKKDVSGLYRFIAKWLLRNGIRQVAGPVCSGALMSYAISVASKGKIEAVYLRKSTGHYEPRIHSEEGLRFASYVLVDDIISSGREMRYCIKVATEQTSLEPSAILCLNHDGCLATPDFGNIPVFKAAFVRG